MSAKNEWLNISISAALSWLMKLIMIGMLIQWPTIITAFMFPVLLYVYYRLSKREEREVIELFGDEYRHYMKRTPMFIPRLGGKA